MDGIGIMNIVPATVMERTMRQFLTENVLISVGGGLLSSDEGIAHRPSTRCGLLRI